MREGGFANLWSALPRPLRYVVVGGANTVFGYGAYAALLFAGLPYAGAALLGTLLGVLFNFLTTGGLVFDGIRRTTLIRFIAVYALLYAINVALLAVLKDVAIGSRLLGPYTAGLVLILPMALLSYLLMRRFVFRKVHVAH